MGAPTAGHSLFFREDVVQNIQSGQYATVMRSWNDEEELELLPDVVQRDPLMRPLLNGEVGLITDTLPSERLITPESGWRLVERPLHIGDTCKISYDSPMTGIVLSYRTQARLQHSLTKAPTTPEWVSSDIIKPYCPIGMGDLVIHDDWLGKVEDILESVAGQLPRTTDRILLAEFIGRLRVGDRLPPDTPQMPGAFELPTPEVILQTQPLVVCIAWLAINQQLPGAQAEAKSRPPKYWYGGSLNTLTFFKRSSESGPRMHDRVVFRDPSAAQAHGVSPITLPPIPSHYDTVQVDAMTITHTRTEVDVLWQDGTTSNIPSTSLIPFPQLDDLDCWPGDYVTWSSDGEKRVAVVQTLDPKQRTAYVRWQPTPPGEEPIALVSGLELDPRGDLVPDSHEMFGVQRGDIVFIHAPGTTNGSVLPRVPKIGEIEPWVRDPGGIWREEMYDFGSKIPPVAASGIKVRSPDSSIRWVGEVMHLHTTGAIDVRVPDGSIETVPVSQLTVLRDFVEEGMFDWLEEENGSGDEGSEMDVDEILFDEHEAHAVHGEKGTGARSTRDLKQFEEDERKAWDHLDSEPAQIVKPPTIHLPPPGTASLSPPLLSSPTQHAFSHPTTPMAGGAESPLAWPESPVASSSSLRSESGASTPLGVPSIPPELEASASGLTTAGGALRDVDLDETPWTSFEILSSVPRDHAFFGQAPSGQPTKGFTQRLRKEFKVLSSSLPESILVRAYEDRADLLRCLIIGSKDTPYEDAPFVIDWMLPSAFPHEPPIAHFHSWTNGNGRVNPNLYEEGKVCLSILGTWAGEKVESWSAARSSLLQAFVSIQGLVLVKEPYFCEPSFERLRGTEEGVLSSRMYSEKAYVLARGFIRHALEHPISDLSDALGWLYYTRGTLRKVIEDAERLISKSRKADMAGKPPAPAVPLGADEPAVPRLTLGGILPLSRTLNKLNVILEEHERDIR